MNLAIVWKGWGKPRISSVRIVSVFAEIQTENFRNTRLERYRYTSLLGKFPKEPFYRLGGNWRRDWKTCLYSKGHFSLRSVDEDFCWLHKIPEIYAIQRLYYSNLPIILNILAFSVCYYKERTFYVSRVIRNSLHLNEFSTHNSCCVGNWFNWEPNVQHEEKERINKYIHVTRLRSAIPSPTTSSRRHRLPRASPCYSEYFFFCISSPHCSWKILNTHTPQQTPSKCWAHAQVPMALPPLWRLTNIAHWRTISPPFWKSGVTIIWVLGGISCDGGWHHGLACVVEYTCLLNCLVAVVLHARHKLLLLQPPSGLQP